jgi:DNA polymerase III gamma/tau subunit
MVPPFGTCDISKSGEKRSSSDLHSIDGTNGNEIDVNQRIESKLNIKPVLLCLNRKKTIPVRRISQKIERGMFRKLTIEFIK